VKRNAAFAWTPPFDPLSVDAPDLMFPMRVAFRKSMAASTAAIRRRLRALQDGDVVAAAVRKLLQRETDAKGQQDAIAEARRRAMGGDHGVRDAGASFGRLISKSAFTDMGDEGIAQTGSLPLTPGTQTGEMHGHDDEGMAAVDESRDTDQGTNGSQSHMPAVKGAAADEARHITS